MCSIQAHRATCGDCTCEPFLTKYWKLCAVRTSSSSYQEGVQLSGNYTFTGEVVVYQNRARAARLTQFEPDARQIRFLGWRESSPEAVERHFDRPDAPA